MNEEMRSPIHRLLAFDDIRFFKLFEIVQYMVLTVIVALILSSYVDSFFDQYDPKDYMTDLDLLTSMITELVVLAIVLYYIKKIVFAVPFLGIPLVRITKSSYVPNKKGEASVGIAVGLSLVFTRTATNLSDKIVSFRKRFPPKRRTQNITPPSTTDAGDAPSDTDDDDQIQRQTFISDIAPTHT